MVNSATTSPGGREGSEGGDDLEPAAALVFPGEEVPKSAVVGLAAAEALEAVAWPARTTLQYSALWHLICLITWWGKSGSCNEGNIMARTEKKVNLAANPDPMRGEPGAHPVGVGVSPASDGAAGGAVSEPAGTALGAVVGAATRGLAGKTIVKTLDPTVEDAYWSEQYSSRSYYDKSIPYSEYRPAYRYGWESRAKHAKCAVRGHRGRAEKELGVGQSSIQAQLGEGHCSHSRCMGSDRQDHLTKGLRLGVSPPPRSVESEQGTRSAGAERERWLSRLPP